MGHGPAKEICDRLSAVGMAVSCVSRQYFNRSRRWCESNMFRDELTRENPVNGPNSRNEVLMRYSRRETG